MRLSGKRIVLTGASSGIGKALLAQLARFDVTIVAAARRADIITEHKKELGANGEKIHVARCDVSVPSEIDSLFDFALRAMGGVDIFIANAGFAYYEKCEKPDWGHLVKIFDTNVFSVIYSLLKLREVAGENKYFFVDTASGMSKIAVPGYAMYSATKAALDRFAEGFRFEKEKNGHVMLVYPIATRTNFFNVAGESVPIAFPVQEPSTVARAIIKGIKRDKKSVYPSFLFQVMLVIDAVFPFARVIYQLIELRKFKKWQNRNK